MTARASVVISLLLACTASALAQPPDRDAPENEAPESEPQTPLAGPADVLNGANRATDQAETESAESPAPALTEETRRALARARGGEPELASSRRDPTAPPGTIRVQVVDPSGGRVAGATVRIGIMEQAGVRDERTGETDAAGQFELTGLPTGSGQAYRVTVPVDGAVYATTPFRLEVDAGQIARVIRVPTTRESRALLIQIGQTMLEYRNERLHVTEQIRLTNLGEQTVVFGEEGAFFELPDGFTAFQTHPVMTDQRLVPGDDGFHLRGSLPPGTVTLAWVYDLPLDGEGVEFAHPIPFRVYRYRVMSDASTTMRLSVEGFPSAEAHEAQGRRLLVTEVARAPEDARLSHLAVSVRGIPGPGPGRLIALGGALVLLMLGFLLLTRLRGRSSLIGEARARRKTELLDEARELARAFRASEIGPKFHARRMGELEAELASLLRLDDADALADAGRKSSAVRPAARR